MGFFDSLLNTLSSVNPVTAVINGVSSGISSLLNRHQEKENRKASLKAVEMNNQAQMDLMHEQNAWNEEMWNKQNEYNTPLAQRNRMLAAGINPNFQDGIGPGISSDLPSSASANLQSPLDALSAAAQMTQVDIAQNLAFAQSANLLSGARLANAQAQNQETEGKYLAQIKEGQLELQNSQIALNVEETSLTRKEGLKVLRECKVFDQTVQNLGAQLDLLQKQAASEEANKKLIEEQTNTEQSKQGVLDAQAGLAEAQTEETKENVELIKQKELTEQEQRNTMKSVQAANYAGAEAARQQARLTAKEVEWYDKKVQDQLNNSKVYRALGRQQKKQVYQATKKLAEDVLLAKKNNRLFNATFDFQVESAKVQLQYNKDLQRWQANVSTNQEKYGEAKEIIGMASEVIGTATNALSLGLGGKSGNNLQIQSPVSNGFSVPNSTYQLVSP